VSIFGTPAQWTDLIDSMVPDILNLVITSWREMPLLSAHASEDDITYELCRVLRRNKNARDLPFRIDTQAIEIDPLQAAELGRMDITFSPPINREEYYFCMESKRLNARRDGKARSYASEYVKFGMSRFITGQYAKVVRHGGMLAYVLDGNIARAMANVENNVRKQHAALGMTAPGRFVASTIFPTDRRLRETHHQRPHECSLFRIHHLFMGVTGAATRK
jgi:hypothetical protein